MKKAAVIGHFGGNELFLDGQTVKTKTVTEWLKKEYGADQIAQYDTHRKYSFFFKSPILILCALKQSENFVMLPAQNSLRVLTPIIVAWNILFHRKLHYVVIGGWLPQILTKRKALASLLKRFDYIYVETSVMKRALEDQGFCNITVLPNCKDIRIVDKGELLISDSMPYRLCTFSRVMKEKGIEDAIRAVKQVNSRLGKTAYLLDIYGKVDAAQTEWFEELQRTFSPDIAYQGSVDFNKSVETVKSYFALLFPTHFYTEGVPGTIIDAYAAGVPVIASRWESFSDIISEGVTGIGYDFDDPDGLVGILGDIVKKPETCTNMRKMCASYARRFLPENVMCVLAANM